MSACNIPETNFDNELFSYEYLLDADVCRFCWTGDGTVEIFGGIPRSSDVGEQLVDKIRDCLNLDLDPDLHPVKLCDSCSNMIETIHQFKNFCHESDKNLKKVYEKHAVTLPHVINTDIKIEEVTGEEVSGEIQGPEGTQESRIIRVEIEEEVNENTQEEDNGSAETLDDGSAQEGDDESAEKLDDGSAQEVDDEITEKLDDGSAQEEGDESAQKLDNGTAKVGVAVSAQKLDNRSAQDADLEIVEENEFDKFQRSVDINKIYVKEVEYVRRSLRQNTSSKVIVNLEKKDEDAIRSELLPSSTDRQETTSQGSVKSDTSTVENKEKPVLNTNENKEKPVLNTNKSNTKTRKKPCKKNKNDKPRKPYHTKNTLPEFCTTCGMIFEDIHQLASHNLQVHGINDDAKVFRCYGCEKVYPKKKTRVRHELLFCKNLKDGYKCSLCDRYLPYRKVLQWHLKEHSDPKDAVKLPVNIFKCKKCQKSFKTREKLLMHKDMGDPKHPKKDYVCETCGRKFSRADYLYQHRILHTGIKKHKCPHCSYSAVQRTSLVIHLRKHTGERPYACDVCPHRCVSKSNLIAHRRRHLGTNRLQCPLCPKLFGYKTSLDDHIANSHEQDVSYVCQFCRLSYGRKSCLDRHMRLKHTFFKETREAREFADSRMLIAVDPPKRADY